LQVGERGRRLLLGLRRERSFDLPETLRHRGRGPFGVVALREEHAQPGCLVALRALRDEVSGLVALILESLDQGGDVRVEIGHLLHPVIGQGALNRRRDTDAAERDGCQGRDGDQQEEARADAPVLQPVP
jgi:hypothetical protein